MDTSKALRAWLDTAVQCRRGLLDLLEGLRTGSGLDTPPLSPKTSGRFRIREILTGVEVGSCEGRSLARQEDVRVNNVPDPIIQEPTDAIVRITSTAICGSDLHLYAKLSPLMREGDIIGHEPMGIVEEVGSDVEHISPGDRVVIPFNISCGHCYFCDQQLYSQCENTRDEASSPGP